MRAVRVMLCVASMVLVFSACSSQKEPSRSVAAELGDPVRTAAVLSRAVDAVVVDLQSVSAPGPVPREITDDEVAAALSRWPRQFDDVWVNVEVARPFNESRTVRLSAPEGSTCVSFDGLGRHATRQC